MVLLGVGIGVLLVASLLQAYCAVGTQASPVHAPEIFYSPAGKFLVLGWIVLFVAGSVLLFLENWIVGVVGVVAYLLVLPVLLAPVARRWLLGSWDEVRELLEKDGYTKRNYLRGDWWKK